MGGEEAHGGPITRADFPKGRRVFSHVFILYILRTNSDSLSLLNVFQNLDTLKTGVALGHRVTVGSLRELVGAAALADPVSSRIIQLSSHRFHGAVG